MIQPEYINICCVDCGKESKFHKDSVRITLDLWNNRYIFEAKCPECGNHLTIVRWAFQ